MVTKGEPVYGAVYAYPAQVYYIRETKNDPAPFGPVSLEVAKGYSRRASRMNVSGLSEVFTIVGTRPEDPLMRPVLKVLLVYRRGKALVGGTLAQYVSQYEVPPAI